MRPLVAAGANCTSLDAHTASCTSPTARRSLDVVAMELGGGEPVPAGVDVTVHLTGLGRRLAARRQGVRATVHLHVTVPGSRWPGRRAWSMTLRT